MGFERKASSDLDDKRKRAQKIADYLYTKQQSKHNGLANL